jgi:hypothetical protein
LALFVYAITLFVSAFLLFLVQPIIGQKILPKLGGTPSVWNTCVIFFQLTLLAGYAYTHFTTKLPVRRQILIHCGLLFVPFLILLPRGPFPVEDFLPVTGGNPTLPTLWLLATIVGIPFFVVSTTAPLLQKWFVSTGHPAAKDPYFLYGASNLGSMLALLLYPFPFEPLLGLEAQSWFYTFGYMALVGMVISCAMMAFQSAPKMVQLPSSTSESSPEAAALLPAAPAPGPLEAPPVTAPATDLAAMPAPSAEQTTAPPAAAATAVTGAAPPPAPRKPSPATAIKKGGKKGKGKGRDLAKFAGVGAAPAATPAAIAAISSAPTAQRPATLPTPGADDEITWPRRLRWIGLAAVPSSLMLGVTTYMSTDISAIPLFWVIPLALYLLSFILVFMRWPINWVEDAHQFVLYAQPFMLAGLALFMAISNVSVVVYLIGFMLLAFLTTALACHGEMAKDRPSAKHLTEFYLLMSVGGAVGGLFNGIVAPMIFKWGVIEFSLALFVAAILRPKMSDLGWTEMLVANLSSGGDAGGRGGPKGRRIVKSTAETQALTTILDFAYPLAVLGALAILLYVVFDFRRGEYAQSMFFAVIGPAICCACFFARPLRFGLALGAILLLTGTMARQNIVFETRSYFGLLRVQRSYERWGSSNQYVPYVNLMHGTTNHGMALQRGDDPSIPNLTRVATTYYHRKGPVGICMERFNWFAGGEELDEQSFVRFDSDARMPVSLIASGMPNFGVGGPLSQLVTTWSEPPYAVIGLGTGTMASYGRPYQAVHFYEIDEQIRRLSLPEGGGEPFFGYLQAALKRGTDLKVLMGDARLRMAMPWIPKKYQKPGFPSEYKEGIELKDVPFDERGGPEYFYHLMVVDAFSSDAIPRHLITKQAMEMYFRHLVPGHWGPWVDVDPRDPSKQKDGALFAPKFYYEEGKLSDGSTRKRMWVPGGVLCVHTSNRHLALVPVVRDTAAKVEWVDFYDGKPEKIDTPKTKVGLVAVRGHDNAPGNSVLKKNYDIGHFTSEWVMVARDRNDLKHLVTPPKYSEWIRDANKDKPANQQFRDEQYWQEQTPLGDFVWTDDHSNLMAVFRWPWAH